MARVTGWRGSISPAAVSCWAKRKMRKRCRPNSRDWRRRKRWSRKTWHGRPSWRRCNGLRKRPPWHFDADSARRELTKHFGTRDLSGFGAESLHAAIGAAGCLLGYLQETQKAALPHLSGLAVEQADDTIAMDAATRRNLELDTHAGGACALHPARRARPHDHADGRARCCGAGCTARCAIAKCCAHAIRPSRALIEDRTCEPLRDVLRSVGDLERILARVALRSARPRDLVHLAGRPGRCARDCRDRPRSRGSHRRNGHASAGSRRSPRRTRRHRRTADARHRRTPAAAAARRRRDRRRLRRRVGRAAPAFDECGPIPARSGTTRARRHRHRDAQGRLQPRARLLHRIRQGARRQGARALHAATDLPRTPSATSPRN